MKLLRIIACTCVCVTVLATGCAKCNTYQYGVWSDEYRRAEFRRLISDSWRYFDSERAKGNEPFEDREKYFDYLRSRGYDLDKIFEIDNVKLENAINDRLERRQKRASKVN